MLITALLTALALAFVPEGEPLPDPLGRGDGDAKVGAA